ncbi:MAG: hypothetical protein COU35_03715 [Candidatus Magasanikbacteria bacterium CG10_big_fil_rev_8_21_14_0_10_47_10]|uniref:MPN domain-containing protein n=1 Tax=Candidatus Magasanikbacteria bacterium CG10_big_fil_rev_8_21_14_0_10_47_10 TaxID=1974652 RepID=A0A2H0TPS8_9BACT|nr:MAG: hypothetical protein COU35_03715 [Candidatus Magasanikbacteria bacterium CG10_big_fil_rev_8_21_14_0_10_47_10]
MKTEALPHVSTKYVFSESDLVLSEDRKYVLKIRDMEEADKPRERMMKSGAGVLSTAELLAVILNVGTRKEEVLSMASRIITEYGDKNICNQKDPAILSGDLDIPMTKACQIVASFELGRRFFQKNPAREVTIRTAKQVYRYLADMKTLPKEQLRGLYLNSRFRVIHDEVISIGSLTANVVHPREVFGPALAYSAAAVIIAHNHPSGTSTATRADIEVTEQLVKAGKILGIDILDHVIIARNSFSSVPVKY